VIVEIGGNDKKYNQKNKKVGEMMKKKDFH